MNTQDVAKRLIELCSQGAYDQAHKELYAQNAVSIEPEGANWAQRTEGMEAINAKSEQYQNMVEAFHESNIEGPLVAGNSFSIRMTNDVTFKGMGRMKQDELCVYEVQEGKIVKEQFFYPVAPPQ